MERKIGEIFEYNGEWYQCVEGNVCENCAFKERKCYLEGGSYDPIGECCYDRRRDNKDIIFKKLEKVGEPYEFQKRTIQTYKLYIEPFISVDMDFIWAYVRGNNTIDIIIKQNKEDMEENKLNLKPFDLQKAREGKPVCTRDGRKARIICFDRKDNTPIVALIECVNHAEILQCVHNDGKCFHYDTSNNDLMMLPEKKEGWVNVYRDCDGANITKDDNIYSSKDAAIASAQIIDGDNYVATIKIQWEE